MDHAHYAHSHSLDVPSILNSFESTTPSSSSSSSILRTFKKLSPIDLEITNIPFLNQKGRLKSSDLDVLMSQANSKDSPGSSPSQSPSSANTGFLSSILKKKLKLPQAGTLSRGASKSSIESVDTQTLKQMSIESSIIIISNIIAIFAFIRSHRIELKVYRDQTIEATIKQILELLKVAKGLVVNDNNDHIFFEFLIQKPRMDIVGDDDDEFDENVAERVKEYKIWKKDRSSPGLRSWLNPEKTIRSYNINNGDELTMNHIEEQETVYFSIPPDPTIHTFEYGLNVSIKEIYTFLEENNYFKSEEEQLKNFHTETKKPTYAIYNTRLGIWFDDTKNLWDYVVHKDDNLVVREVSLERILRVNISNFNTTFALRILPSMTGKDIVSMIRYQMSNRKLELSQRGHYELYYKPGDIWISKDNPISFYESEILIIVTIEYKLRYQTVKINYALTNQFSTFLFLPQTTTKEVLETCTLGTIHQNVEYGLYLRSGQQVLEKDSLWDLLLAKEWSETDYFIMRSVYKKVFLKSNISGSSVVKMEVCIDEKMRNFRADCVVERVARRFGLVSGDISMIMVDEKVLDVEKSLMEQEVFEGETLYIKFNEELVPGSLQNLIFRPEPWFEPKNNDTIQYVEVNTLPKPKVLKIASATLNKLVDRIAGEGDEAYLDFSETFFLTYQSFTTADELLEKLIERFWVASKTWPQFEHERSITQTRVCNILLTWTKKYTSDFVKLTTIKDEIQQQNEIPAEKHGSMKRNQQKNFVKELLSFTEEILAYDHPMIARQIRRNIIRLSENRAVEALSSTRIVHHEDFLPETRDIILSYPPEKIAQQLTHIEYILYSKILPSELLNQQWAKSNAKTSARNISAITNRFNSVASWITKSIVEKKDAKSRGKVIQKFIQIGSELLELKNFATLMAVIAGLNKSPVSRLKQSFKEVGSNYMKKLKELEALMAAESSYKKYRQVIEQIAPPCIPYIGVFLIDLTYMEDGNPDLIVQRINFFKRDMISKVLRKIQTYQEATPIKTEDVIDDLVQLLWNIPNSTSAYEKELWDESKSRE